MGPLEEGAASKSQREAQPPGSPGSIGTERPGTISEALVSDGEWGYWRLNTRFSH